MAPPKALLKIEKLQRRLLELHDLYARGEVAEEDYRERRHDIYQKLRRLKYEPTEAEEAPLGAQGEPPPEPEEPGRRELREKVRRLYTPESGSPAPAPQILLRSPEEEVPVRVVGESPLQTLARRRKRAGRASAGTRPPRGDLEEPRPLLGRIRPRVLLAAGAALGAVLAIFLLLPQGPGPGASGGGAPAFAISLLQAPCAEAAARTVGLSGAPPANPMEFCARLEPLRKCAPTRSGPLSPADLQGTPYTQGEDVSLTCPTPVGTATTRHLFVVETPGGLRALDLGI
ncbi:MAG: hypothetical protein HY558_08385 [Euryarchaeota archaeon]|nr:hypothetical protein [Euryarchaeota archaeon]